SQPRKFMLASLLRVHCIRKRRNVLATTLTRVNIELKTTIANITDNVTLISARLRNFGLLLCIEFNLLRIRDSRKVNKSLIHGIGILGLLSDAATGNARNFDHKSREFERHNGALLKFGKPRT
ncbi:hypothetical protein, partial [Pseudomonas amygdali]|uniref:hypothetical protein n=1 Tax=Pseudomonas amygdali TaxID=47877 RepID=UPI001C8246DC